MSARVITSLVAVGALVASLAIASPVQAGHDKNLKRFVGAAIGLYILGQAIENNNRGRVVQQRHTYRPRHHHGGQKWKKRGHKRNNAGTDPGRHARGLLGCLNRAS